MNRNTFESLAHLVNNSTRVYGYPGVKAALEVNKLN